MYEQKADAKENFPIIEMLIFSEKNFIYQIFHISVSLLSLLSSYFYLYLAAFRMMPHQVDMPTFLYISDSIEGIFLIYIILQFFKSYSPEGGGDLVKPVRYWTDIIFHYLRNDFLMDFIPIIPFQFLTLKRNRERLFFLLKVLRIFKGTKMLSQRKLMRVIKERQLQSVHRNGFIHS